MAQGYLTVTAGISREAAPVSGVRVYIKESTLPEQGSEANRLMQYTPEELEKDEVSPQNFEVEAVTDVDGKTAAIPLEAPVAAKSFMENSTDIPYGVYDVYVDAEGYVPVRYKGVQIYAGTESTLPVNLTPEIGANQFIYVYVIPDNTLFLAPKRTPDSPDEVVSPDISTAVYIPETIAVHLGRPDETAENVYVSFPDYIKNVASSEIYPTWPDEAIRANVHAQVSLALNRVYTEWYPSQGYDFQITNSTAFDQAFVKGRNIFTNVSNIVDEIFNTYIRRDGFVEPLFASYCDGVTTSCSGMSQWGSLYLAEQGYSAQRILKNYYGNDIELVTTDNIVSDEESYPGEPLELGDVSADVAVIQKQLNRIRRNYPSIPVIVRENGRFGSDTDAAVRGFQRIFGMPVTGIVDRAVWYRISYIYAAVKKLAELTSEGESDNFPQEPPTVILRRGDRGDDVTLLQYILSYIGLFYDNISPIRYVDGIFGSATDDAVKQFQREFDLTADGVVGSATWSKLYEVFDGIFETVLIQTPEQSYPGTPLSFGDSSEAVRLIQQYLNVISEAYPDIPAIPETGEFDSDTVSAVRAFQTRFGLTSDGIIGPMTWTRIIEVYNFVTRRDGVGAQSAGTSVNGGTNNAKGESVSVSTSEAVPEIAFPGVDLRRGQRGYHILELQRALNTLFGTKAVGESGTFDNSTESAVREYQRRSGRTPDGIVNEELWNEIFSDNELLL